MSSRLFAIITAFALSAFATAPLAQEVDNGTDPTKIRSQIWTSFEHMDLGNGVTRHTAKLLYDRPLADHTGLRLTLPLVRYQASGLDSDFDFGDFALKITHIPAVTKEYGVVLQAEVMTDTAGRSRLGNDGTTLKGSFIYARFLKGGSIFAPSVSHTETLDNSRVSETVLDFYYVPKLADPTMFVTLDPAFVSNWEQDRKYGSLAVTLGKSVGKAWGGAAQVYVKPTVMIGDERAADWSVEAGFKVIGF